MIKKTRKILANDNRTEISFKLKQDIEDYKAGEKFVITVNDYKIEHKESSFENTKQMILSTDWGTIAEVLYAFEDHIKILTRKDFNTIKVETDILTKIYKY